MGDTNPERNNGSEERNKKIKGSQKVRGSGSVHKMRWGRKK